MSEARFRCSICGNLTRFDVTSTRRSRTYRHYTLGGQLSIEEETVLSEEIESVECRWCGPTGSVERVDPREAGPGDDGSSADP